MIEHLELENVGPAPAMVPDLAPRLNLITGDNGPGKTVLLDVAWWHIDPEVATGPESSPDVRVCGAPHGCGDTRLMRFAIKGKTGSRRYESR